MVINSKTTLFQKLICATLVLSFSSQSLAPIDKPEKIENKSWSERYSAFFDQCTEKGNRIRKQIGKHIYTYWNPYLSALLLTAGIALLASADKERQNVRNGTSQ